MLPPILLPYQVSASITSLLKPNRLVNILRQHGHIGGIEMVLKRVERERK